MKNLFIPAKSKSIINKDKIREVSKKLKKNIAIAYSIQYKEIAEEIKKILGASKNITSFTQVLGCSSPRFPKTTEAILLIGSGKFHALGLSVETNLPIYILNKNKLEEISESESQRFKQKKKASYLKFLNADKIGILVSSKPGQNRFSQAINIKRKIKKKAYLFLSNNINPQEFENFQLKTWVNTACPRLDMDSSIINLKDIKELFAFLNSL